MQPIEINKHQFFKIELLEVPYSVYNYTDGAYFDHLFSINRYQE